MNYAILQPDGKIIVIGQFFYVMTGGGASVPRSGIARFNCDGTFDPTYNPGAGLTSSTAVPQGSFAGQQSSGKIIVEDNFDQYDGHPVPGLVRIKTDGSW